MIELSSSYRTQKERLLVLLMHLGLLMRLKAY